jgi:hypothetical protein
MLNEYQTIAKWNEACNYCWTKQDLQQIVSGIGTIYVYHGCPDDFADSVVSGGFHEYTIYGLARFVAVKYNLPWKLYENFAPRIGHSEKFQKMSTAPILIAFRWASNFKYGEVLSDLNAHARVLRYILDHREPNKSIADQYDSMYNRAIEIGKQPGNEYASTDTFPDLLGLPDRYSRATSTGAIIQIKIKVSVFHGNAKHDAEMTLRAIAENTDNPYMTLRGYNDSYTDIHIGNEDMLSRRVVIRGIPYRCTDYIRELMKQHRVDEKGRII